MPYMLDVSLLLRTRELRLDQILRSFIEKGNLAIVGTFFSFSRCRKTHLMYHHLSLEEIIVRLFVGQSSRNV